MVIAWIFPIRVPFASLLSVHCFGLEIGEFVVVAALD